MSKETVVSTEPKALLFVCVENSNRSQMAEAFARIHGGARVRALSAGSAPSGQVNPKAIAAMAELGYDLSQHRSESLDAVPEIQFAATVTMGCGDACPHIPAERRLDWQIPDPRDLPPEQFTQVRNRIEQEVLLLLAALGISPT